MTLAISEDEYLSKLEQDGFAILAGQLDDGTFNALLKALSATKTGDVHRSREKSVFAIRKLLDVAPGIQEITQRSCIQACLKPALGMSSRIVRGIFFDKIPKANWKVPWHQDVTIAVRDKRESDGFENWTTKAGVPHVQPPLEVLERMLTLRMHLDDADKNNGALRVIPGSHRLGRLDNAAIKTEIEQKESVICNVRHGDIVVMRPLLLHASSSGKRPTHRRVVHIEFSADSLPGGLEWYGT